MLPPFYPCRLYTATKLLFVGAIFISYGLQFYVPLSFVWPPVRNRISERFHTIAEYAFRTGIVIITSKCVNIINHSILIFRVVTNHSPKAF